MATSVIGGAPAQAEEHPSDSVGDGVLQDPEPTTSFLALAPCRLFDSRSSGGSGVPAQSVVQVPTTGRCGVPANATAVSVTLTSTQSADSGYATVFPAGTPVPTASNLNFRVGGTRANSAIAKLGTSGALGVYSHVRSHLVVDVVGAFVPADSARSGRFVATEARRALDTRTLGSQLPPGSTTTVALPDGIPTGAVAVVANLTFTQSAGSGYLTAYASGSRRPTASMLNVDGPGQTRAAGGIIPTGPAGIDIYNHAGGHLIVDIVGYFTGPDAEEATDGLFVPLPPTRLIDTRRTGTPIHADGAIEITGHPEAAAVAVNWTAPAVARRGYVVVYPARTTRPATSTLNHEWDHTAANFSIVELSEHGIAAASSSRTQLIADLAGWFVGTPTASSTPKAPNEAAGHPGNTLIVGDSTLAGLRWQAEAQGHLTGFTYELDAQSCRRTWRPSCRGREGFAPLTVVQTIARSEPGTFQTLVVMSGYNDGSVGFAEGVSHVMTAARVIGAHRVVWLTLRTDVSYRIPGMSEQASTSFASNNAVLRSDARADPQLLIADWNAFTSRRPDWFAADGLHLTRSGAIGLARFISEYLLDLDR